MSTSFQCVLTVKGNVSKIDGTLSNATLDTQGPGGNTSVHINGSDNSFVSFGTQIGQFGTNDFTVAFWVQTTEAYRYFDLAGNRAAGSHGNFFCIRMTGKHESRPAGLIGSEVDQDQNGTNYIGVESKTAGFNDGKWHHIAAVRKGTSLKLYIDGVVSGNGSGQGVANIANGNAFKLGRSLVGVHDKFAADARYSDLRVYDTALNDSDISSLFSSVTAVKLLTNSKIKLKSWKGDYLHRPDTEQGVTSWSTGVGNEWIVESIGDNKIKLKSWKGDYLHRPDSAQGVTSWNTGVGNEWIVESIGDNKIKLKSWKGDYLHRPDSAQGVTTWSTGVGNEWTVEVISTGQQTEAIIGGNEVKSRGVSDIATNFYIVDTNNPFNSNGEVNTWEIWADKTTPVQLIIYRKDAGSWSVVGKSDVKTPVVGLNQFSLSTPITVKKGDYVGFYSPQAGSVSFNRKTEQEPWALGNLSGSILFTASGANATAFSNSCNRTYSLTVKGIVTAEVPKVPPSFDVPGNLETGYEFINTQNVATSYTFTASGTWSPDKNNPSLEGCTAEGLPSFNSYVQDGIKQAWPSIEANMKYPKTPFALVAQNTKTGEVIEVGKKATIVLNPGENLRFVLNDAVWNYDNNGGSIKVDWVIGS